MLETVVLVIFALMLAVGISFHIPLYFTLFGGFILFFIYGLITGHSWKDLLKMAFSGLKSIGGIMLLFVIIGMLTASWRASGTIASITCWSSHIISAESLIVISFILCAAMSFLTGSSYAAAATVGVICMTISSAMHANGMLVGGAIISGSFFGDRSSPLSATVNLVSSLTSTSVFHNVSRLIRTAVVPFILTIIIYLVMGFGFKVHGQIPNFESLFTPAFDLSWPTLIPTLVIIVLSLKKVSVNKTMTASLIVALVLCVTLQRIPVQDLFHILLFGYTTSFKNISHMIDGGGILSMAPIALIVAIASTYAGLFEGTGLLNNLQVRIKKLAERTTPFCGVFATGLLTTVIACDQILSIMLTKQLCDELEVRGEALALDQCNSATVIAGFVPWSTVCVGILAFLDAPTQSCLAACFTYLVPLWLLLLSFYQKSHPNLSQTKLGQLLGLEEYDDARSYQMNLVEEVVDLVQGK